MLHMQHLSKYQHFSTLPKPTPQALPRQPSRPKQPSSRQRAIPRAFHSVTSSTASIASTLAHPRAPPIREDGSPPPGNHPAPPPPQPARDPRPERPPPLSQDSSSSQGSSQ